MITTPTRALRLLTLSGLLLCAGCSPKSQTPIAKKPTPVERQDNGYSSGRRRVPSRVTVNWAALEKRIPRVKERTQKALKLIRDANDIKKLYDNATGAERASLSKRMGDVYRQAGDVYDELIMDVDDIHDREKIKEGSLLSRGPVLASFTRKWDKLSKPFKRMAFRK